MGVIFDLDQTLINSSSLENLRKARKWSEVYNRIPTIPIYEGISNVLEWLDTHKIPVAIVTNSPESYCKRIIKFNQWNIHSTVCYHDVKRRKPAPDPMNLALKQLGLSNTSILSIGDRHPDMIASKKAGIKCIAALWGTKERNLLLSSNPDFKAENTKELQDIITSFFSH